MTPCGRSCDTFKAPIEEKRMSTNGSQESSGAPPETSEAHRQPVAPYLAVGLSTVVYGVAERKHITWNLDTIEDGIHAAMSIIGINMPVRLVALAEGALTGFTDEAFDIPHVVAAHELFIDIPGPETERLASLARHYDTYVVVQCKARWPEVMPDRFFNTLFVISPTGEVVHKAAKNHLWCRERSCTPHDVYDRWVELFGDGIDAFYPVLRTEDIGNVGTICCSDGEYPEAVRALAFNGAEVVYRPSEAVPMTNAGSVPGGTWLLQNRAHAHFNSVYMLCPNVGPVYLHPRMKHPYDIGGGNSHIVDYIGNVVSHSASGYNTFVSGIVDIEALRQFRVMNLNSNWMKDLRTEVFRRMYEEPIHPKNLCLEQHPKGHAEVDEVYRANIERLVERGTFTLPAHHHPGARYIPMDDMPPMQSWLGARTLWVGAEPDRDEHA
jgi:predicted amidohydrolase